MTLKSIGVLSVAKIFGVMYAVIGLLIGLVFAAGASLLPHASETSEVPAWLGPVAGVGAIVVLPICYGLLGAVSGAVGAVIYNFFAKFVGGIVLNLEPPAGRV